MSDVDNLQIPAQQEVVILDGGMSNALGERGHVLSDSLWTARLLTDAPEEIAAVHRAYFDAGAQVATTCSYQASVPGFVAAGFTTPEAEALLVRSVTLAMQARDAAGSGGRRRLVAASIGPYGAYLADGSEYRGRYGVSRSVLRDFHAPRLELLAGARPDLVAVETIPDTDEAEVIVRLLDDIAVPAWFCYSIDGERTRAGQPLHEAFEVAAAARSAVAIGVNCCNPADVLPAVQSAVSRTGRPAIAYPNSGAAWLGSTAGWSGGSSYDVSLALSWVAAGARYVGGCCQVGPADIRALKAVLQP